MNSLCLGLSSCECLPSVFSRGKAPTVWSEEVSVFNACILQLPYAFLHLQTGLWNIKPGFRREEHLAQERSRCSQPDMNRRSGSIPTGSGSGSGSGTLWRGMSLLPPWPDLESGQTSTPWWMPTDVCPNLMGLESKAGSRWAWRRESHGP